MRVIENFTVSKTGDERLNEDGIYFDENFVAVIDGATSKKLGTIDGISSGRFAMLVVKTAISKADPNASALDTLRYINGVLREKVKEVEISADSDSPAVSIVICNINKREIVSYGDCAFSINGVVYKKIKRADKISAEKRTKVIKSALESGATVEQIRNDDIGRKAILNDLIYQAENYANVDIDGGFACINGTGIIDAYAQVVSFENGSEIVLCSDGYPEVRDTLEESEKRLATLLEKDVLCINELCGTKGVNKGCISFDDRAYVRFAI